MTDAKVAKTEQKARFDTSLNSRGNEYGSTGGGKGEKVVVRQACWREIRPDLGLPEVSWRVGGINTARL